MLSDTMGSSGQTYIPGSFELRRVKYDSKGNLTQVIETIDLTGKLQISSDGRSFTLNLGNLNGEQFDYKYRTTYTPNTTLKNSLKLQSTEKTETRIAEYKSANSGGSGEGDLTNKIKIVKVDAENHETKLSGAEFEITRVSDGQKFTLKTNAKGEAVSEKLIVGEYKIKEITAPAGFELNSEEITVSVSNGKAVIKTICDKPIKTSVSVSKKWIGKAVYSVTVHLYADGIDTGNNVVLNQANSWKYTFEGLRKYKIDGTEIQYTVKEDIPVNYEGKVEGNAKDGFVITNKNVEKITIPIEKKWVGPSKDSVTVKLLADGIEKETVTLKVDTNWKHTFKDLPKYSETDGHEIVYTIKEVQVEGYVTGISGDAKNGFTITNTKATPKTSDDSNDLSLYGGMLMSSLGMLIFMFIKRKRHA